MTENSMDERYKRTQLYRTQPRSELKANEQRRWRRFLSYVIPWLADKSDPMVPARVEPMDAEATKAAEEASRIAAEADEARPRALKVFADAIDQQVGEHDPAAVTKLKIAALLEADPGLKEQVEKVQRMASAHGIRWTVVDPHHSPLDDANDDNGEGA